MQLKDQTKNLIVKNILIPNLHPNQQGKDQFNISQLQQLLQENKVTVTFEQKQSLLTEVSCQMRQNKLNQLNCTTIRRVCQKGFFEG
ncbi:hypothetical protein TTHERM_000016049 (macronuclear) [Tetrahymena thermophila SB210]|uniref:Uncharacterized protein n=1 Tax=Tetrahymena thermophila (strain SB210) TaxID=312017 RepID=W7XEZ7_TETTS|nr:hypothetical protein TTHERM_000016049 [Tetrahymena thermophila SB210]EWS76367.1 hypothetical protein TTHERM_000016049 [Tetrahymena thermophila SB210]|eukprot:XP_012651151.1 hypothetical protein TTHERM_000016049 [Tetrahymena thermophila SB210]